MIVQVAKHLKCREQPQLTLAGANAATDGRGDEAESDQIARLVLNHKGILGTADQTYQMLHVVNLLIGQGNHAVQFGKGHVDDLHSAAYVWAYLLHVTELLDRVAVALLGNIGNLVHLGRNLIGDNYLGLGPVPFFCQPQTLHVLYVIGVVVEGDIHVKLVKAVHQHALLVQVGESQRTHQFVHAKLARPAYDRVKKRL